MPGMKKIVISTKVLPKTGPRKLSWSRRKRNTTNRSGSMILCPIVTTGKCLIGLTVGSIKRLA